MVIQSKKVPIGEIWFAESLLPELTMFIEIFKVSLGQIKSERGELRNNKRGCVFSMVIWTAYRMGQYRVNDHP